MNFIVGQTKRPKHVEDNGQVVFEHYTRVSGEGPDKYELTETTPTEEECKAYGFLWNTETSKCGCKAAELDRLNVPSVGYNSNLHRGSSVIRDNVENSMILGEGHYLGRVTSNNTVSGFYNYLNDSVTGSTITGTRGNATISNHYVHGGNTIADITGERQYTRVIFGVKTTDGETNDSYINNDGVNFYPIPENSIMYFNVSVIAVRVGGTGSGDVGDYGSWLERGVVINQAGTLAIKRARKTMSHNGTTTNWRPTAAIDGTNFKVTFRGHDDMDVEWTATVDFTEFRASVSLE